MLRGPFPGHRRYSITHRAVQRLRELVPTMDDLDDEALRDQLDVALGKAEDGGKAVRTLDAMLGEPQVLIPVEEFGETLFAIIKEDTVVTVLPKGHGEEILQRGQALQAKVATGEVQMPDREPVAERWEGRRRWRREAPGPVVIERPRPVIVRDEPEPTTLPARASGGLSGSTARGVTGSTGRSVTGSTARGAGLSSAGGSQSVDAATLTEDTGWVGHAPTPERPDEPVAAALWDALERGSRRAVVAALHELIDRKERDDDLLPVWNEIAELGIPQGLKLGDLIDACALSKQAELS
ncbi:hypothetical protein [Enhygromyxa salina]|uniref:Uncharacterized protein n=1 Tax=Enhygromyxa salina TaxID=215803 RepID=A0A2S9Y2F8_9BACT|nr:hypothetical protein [Enhygromyxa salina]PRP99293.1 hypothetical protein ENSA7_63350 [Enhygromyxa salina]